MRYYDIVCSGFHKICKLHKKNNKQIILHTERHKVVVNSNAVGESYIQFFIDSSKKSELAPFAYLDMNEPLEVEVRSLE